MLRLVALHKEWKWKEGCTSVLNEEWPKSVTWRNHSLEKSSENFPCCLILVLDDKEVIGHSRLSSVIGKPACFVESVVIKKDKRGQGYGKILMQKTEEYVTNIGMRQLYLTTHDKQEFYQHIGYQYCQPVVSICSASFISPNTALKLFGSSVTSNEGQPISTNDSRTDRNSNFGTNTITAAVTMESQQTAAASCVRQHVPPPPPPIPHYQPAYNDVSTLTKMNSVWMMKQL